MIYYTPRMRQEHWYLLCMSFLEATRVIAQDAPVVFLHHESWQKAWRASVAGYREIPDGRMRFEPVWLKE